MSAPYPLKQELPVIRPPVGLTPAVDHFGQLFMSFIAAWDSWEARTVNLTKKSLVQCHDLPQCNRPFVMSDRATQQFPCDA